MVEKQIYLCVCKCVYLFKYAWGDVVRCVSMRMEQCILSNVREFYEKRCH